MDLICIAQVENAQAASMAGAAATVVQALACAAQVEETADCYEASGVEDYHADFDEEIDITWYGYFSQMQGS